MSGEGVLVISAWVEPEDQVRARIRDSRDGENQLGTALGSRADIVAYVDDWLGSLITR